MIRKHENRGPTSKFTPSIHLEHEKQQTQFVAIFHNSLRHIFFYSSRRAAEIAPRVLNDKIQPEDSMHSENPENPPLPQTTQKIPECPKDDSAFSKNEHSSMQTPSSLQLSVRIENRVISCKNRSFLYQI